MCAGARATGSLAATGSKAEDQRRELIAALRETGGNQSRAARLLGINRVTVWNRMRKYGIDLKRELKVSV
jgi:transcriptional regulator of acetoin/glycerol metabolism